jgi:hypothetical protein
MQTYIVMKGDTLGKIAKRFYGDAGRFTLIVTANAIPNPDRLKVGASLTIPDLATTGTSSAASGSATITHAPVPAPGGSLSERRLASLHPIVADRGRRMLALCAERGVSLLVTQGLRTWEEQDALFAKGRTVPPIGKKHIVTNAKGGKSWHNFGLAFDIVVLDAVGKADWDTRHAGWAQAATVGKSIGLEWGGDWTSFKDLPHYQYTGGLSLAQCRAAHTAGGLRDVWHRVR